MVFRILRSSRSRKRVCHSRLAIPRKLHLDLRQLLLANGFDFRILDNSQETIAAFERFEPATDVDKNNCEELINGVPAAFVFGFDRKCAFLVTVLCNTQPAFINNSVVNNDESVVRIERCPRGVWKIVTSEEELLERKLIEVLEGAGARLIPRTCQEHIRLCINSYFVLPLAETARPARIVG